VWPALLERRLRTGGHEDLLIVGDGRVTAKALSYDDLRSMDTLDSAVREHLIIRAIDALDTRALDRLARTIPPVPASPDDDLSRIGASLVSFGHQMTGLQRQVCRAAGDRTSLTLQEEVHTMIWRYYALGWATVFRTQPSAAAIGAQQGLVDHWRELLVAAARRRGTVVVELLRRIAEQGLELAQRSLELDLSDAACEITAEIIRGDDAQVSAGHAMKVAIGGNVPALGEAPVLSMDAHRRSRNRDSSGTEAGPSGSPR